MRTRDDDPPEYPDPPQCPKCELWETCVQQDGKTVECDACGYAWELPPEPDYTEAEIEESQERIAAVLGITDDDKPYDYAADDLAFDAERERRMK